MQRIPMGPTGAAIDIPMSRLCSVICRYKRGFLSLGGYDGMIINAYWPFSENIQGGCVVQCLIIANAHRRYVEWFDKTLEI
jgi:hypothetical protein